MKTDRTIALRMILTTFSIVAIAFIFYNSSFSADESSLQSGLVLSFINGILKSFGIGAEASELFIRKTAHFVEYFVLGLLLSSAAYNYVLRISRTLMIALPIGLSVAVIDEVIQLSSEGRSFRFGDIALDFSAVLAAAMILMFIIHLVKRKRGYYQKGFFDSAEGR